MDDELRRCPILDENGRVPFGVTLAVFPDFTFKLIQEYTLVGRKCIKGRVTNVVLREVELLGGVLVQG